MKIYFTLALSFFAFALGACDKFGDSQDQDPPKEIVKQDNEKVVKNFDVDPLASDNFKAEIKAMFAANATTDIVEAGLKAKGFECRIDPSNKNERGCDKMETRDGCIYMSVVKTLPFAPDGGQIIKVCDVE